MVSDSSKPEAGEPEEILSDNDLYSAPYNVHEKKVHAFPYLDVIGSLNHRINKLEESLALLRSE